MSEQIRLVIEVPTDEKRKIKTAASMLDLSMRDFVRMACMSVVLAVFSTKEAEVKKQEQELENERI